MAETCHGLGEQAMAEYCLGKIPALHVQYYEIAAAIKKGKARLEEAGKAALDRQAREMFAFFGGWPIYRGITEIMEGLWNEGAIMRIYQ